MPRTVKVTITADVAGAVANVATFRGAITGLGSELDKAAVKHPASLGKIATAAGGLGLAMAAGFVVAERSAMAFDRQMSAVGAVAEANASQLDQLRTASINAGRDTAFTATQAAQAEEELAKAGMSTADILTGGLTGALNLAAAGSLDLGQAATIAAQAMNEFGLSGKDIGRIADTLTAGANKSATDVGALGESLSQAGGLAHGLGMSLEDTTGVLAEFAQKGIVGEEAGTVLKQMLLKLEGATGPAADTMKKLGISLYGTNGQFVGMAALAGELQTALQGLTPAEQNAALATIFGARAIRGATILYQDGASGVQGWIDSVTASGTASDTAAKKLDNLSGDLHKLMGSLQAVAISSSSGATTGLRFLAQGAEKTVNAFLGLPKPIGETATVLLGVGGGSLLAAAGLLKVREVGLQAMDALRSIGPVGEKAAGVLGSIGKWGGIAGVAAVGAFALWEGLKALSGWMDKSAQPVHRDIGQLTKDLQAFAESGVATGEMARAFGADLNGLGRDFDAIAKGHLSLSDLSKGMDAANNGPALVYRAQHEAGTASVKAKADVDALDQALADLAKNGGASQAKIAYDRLTASLVAQGIPMGQITSMFGDYDKAARDAAAAGTGAAQGFADAGVAATAMGKGMQDAVDHGQSLLDVFKELNGGAEDFAKANIDTKQALADLADGFKRGKDALNENTQAGRDNMEMIFKATDAAAAAMQAKFAESGSVQAATDTYNGYIGSLRRTLAQAGLTQGQIDSLIATYARIPPAVGTNVYANGAGGAIGQISYLIWLANSLNGRVIRYTIAQTTITQMPGGRALDNARGGVYERAAAGVLRDAGMFATASPARYAFAEPSTGGEAFIPRRGDMARSRAIAEYAVTNWLGGSVSWGGGRGGSPAGGGGGGVTVHGPTVAVSEVERMFSGMFMRLVRTGQIQLKAT